MATISPVSVVASGSRSNYQTVTWSDITTTTDTTVAYDLTKGKGASRASVTFGGTFAGGSTAVLQGSNDDVTYVTLTDLGGNAISCTAAAIFEFVSSCLYIKPGVSGGAADNVDVVVVMRD